MNQDGRPVDQTMLNGKWSLVFFGFTYCPEFCPTTLAELAAVQQRLGDKADDPDRIDLAAFETKPKKSRDSILLKLLHKPENVAEDIFDQVGIRFVTPTLLDSLSVIQFLKDRMILMR